jgi:hypothetical protein
MACRRRPTGDDLKRRGGCRGQLERNQRRYRSVMTTALVLRRASAMVAAAGEKPSPAVHVSITVTAHVLSTIGLLIATCPEIALTDVADSGLRGYAMATNPIRLDALTGDPTVVIHASGIDEPTALTLQVRLEASAPTSETSVVLLHDFGDLTLTAEAPVASLPLPLSSFHTSS